MKKIYILAISILGFHSMNAQITLTAASNTPTVGYSFIQHTYDANPVTPGVSGANITWNFASIGSQSSQNINMVNPSTMSDASNHPLSNVGSSTSSGEVYLFVDGDELSIAGNFSPGTLRESFTDVRELTKFPITYGNSFNETFDGTIYNIGANQTFDRGGTINISADGYGDLILPYGTISNVLRIKAISLYSDGQGGTPFINYYDTTYLWYNASTNFPIMNWTILNSGGFSILKSGWYLDQSSVITSLGDDFIPNNSITIYPNPVSNNQTTILLDKLYENAHLQLIDITGKIVKTENVIATSKNMTLNLDGLNKGIYFVQILHDNTIVSSEKLVLN